MSEMTGRYVSAAATQVQAPTDVHADAPVHVHLTPPSDPNDTHPRKPKLVHGGPENSSGSRDGEATAGSFLGTWQYEACVWCCQCSMADKLFKPVARTVDTSHSIVWGVLVSLESVQALQ
jgi:hypothetical protein